MFLISLCRPCPLSISCQVSMTAFLWLYLNWPPSDLSLCHPFLLGILCPMYWPHSRHLLAAFSILYSVLWPHSLSLRATCSILWLYPLVILSLTCPFYLASFVTPSYLTYQLVLPACPLVIRSLTCPSHFAHLFWWAELRSKSILICNWKIQR